MGSGASKPDQEINSGADQTFFANRDSPVQVSHSSHSPSPSLCRCTDHSSPSQFSETLINHLSSQSTPSSQVPSSRQEALDAHIQSRIQSELAQLRKQEQQVRQEIERALEKENLDREKGKSNQEEGNEGGKGLSHSASLFEDLKQLEKRTAGVKKERQETPEWKQVDEGKKALEKCFSQVLSPFTLTSTSSRLTFCFVNSDNPKTPLECRAEAEKFKAAVAGVEKVKPQLSLVVFSLPR